MAIRPQRLRLIIPLVICTIASGYFLLKQEDSPYGFGIPGRGGRVASFHERGISLVHYYLVWTNSERDAVRGFEERFYPDFLALHGYEEVDSSYYKQIAQIFSQSIPSTLSTLITRNGVITITLGFFAFILLVVLVLSKKFTHAPIQPPTTKVATR